MVYTLRFFPLQNAVCFIILTISFLYYSHFIYRCAKIKKTNSGAKRLRFPDYVTVTQDGGQVSLTHRPPLPPGNAPGTHFC